MGRKAVFRGKVYKSAKFGEGMQPGTVEWELNRRKMRAEERAAEKWFKERQEERARNAPSRLMRVLDAIARFFRTPY